MPHSSALRHAEMEKDSPYPVMMETTTMVMDAQLIAK
jgi:hypothetical protein